MENFRLANVNGFNVIRRDPVETEPVGTLILVPMRVMGYDRDCDGSLMARLEMLDVEDLDKEMDPDLLACETARDFERYGGCTAHHGLYPTSGIVATADEIRDLFNLHKNER